MAKYIDKTQEEWDALIDKWHTTDDIKCSLQEYLELDDIEYLRLIHNITDPTVSDEDVFKISRNTAKEVVAELAIKPELKELEQAIKSVLVDEPEKHVTMLHMRCYAVLLPIIQHSQHIYPYLKNWRKK